MKNPLNDNDELSFITIGAATLNVIRYLQKTEGQTPNEKDHGADSANGRQTKESEKAIPDHKSCYIEQGLARIQRFERSAAGIKGRR